MNNTNNKEYPNNDEQHETLERGLQSISKAMRPDTWPTIRNGMAGQEWRGNRGLVMDGGLFQGITSE